MGWQREVPSSSQRAFYCHRHCLICSLPRSIVWDCSQGDKARSDVLALGSSVRKEGGTGRNSKFGKTQ